MQHISLPVLIDLLFGFFAIFTATLVLIYRKNFSFHNGIAILLFAQGVSSCSFACIDFYNGGLPNLLYILGKALTPIFLLLFSEYTLKLHYNIGIKLLVLTLTFFLGFTALFQMDSLWYINLVNYYTIMVLIIISIHILKKLFSKEDKLLFRYHLIFFIMLLILLSIELISNYTSPGISALIVSHGSMLIIASGGFSHMDQKFPQLLMMLLFGIFLDAFLILLFPDVKRQYLEVLFVLSFFILSLYYIFFEISKNPKRIRSVFLISRLLSSTIHNKIAFITELEKWDEIENVRCIELSDIEGNSDHLKLLFHKTGRVVHKAQTTELEKALKYNPNFISGLEIACFYLKKFDADSLFQLSDKGDFIAVKYITGLNPLLYASELSIMSKMIFSVYSSNK